MKILKKHVIVVMSLALTLLAGSALAQQTQTPPSGTVGTIMNGDETKALGQGWSIKKDILGKDVYNESNQKVGTVEDIIVTREKATSYAIVGAGGFLGMAKHDVAIPINHFKTENNRIILPGATKESIKAMPEFKYKD